MTEIDNIESVATELMNAGKYDAAALYWQKAIDSGLSVPIYEDGQLDFMEQCQYCHEKGCDWREVEQHVQNSQYYNPDSYSLLYDEELSKALDDLNKIPEITDLNYADRRAVEETIRWMTSEHNIYNIEGYDEKNMQKAEHALASLSAKGYPSAQEVMAKRLEERGEYASAQMHYNRLVNNEHISPIRKEHYSEKAGQMSDLRAGKEPRPLTAYNKRDDDIRNHKEPDSVVEPLATEIIASELMEAGKYDAAALYWQKAIDTGLSAPIYEDGQLDFMEQCQYCHEKGCDWREVEQHVQNSQYYNPDSYSLLYDEELSKALDDLNKIPEITDLNYADRRAVEETIRWMTSEHNIYNIEGYDEKNMQKAEHALASLSAKGYPSAQEVMAKRLEERGEYASAQMHYNRLVNNEHISPIRKEHYSEKAGQMSDLRAGKEPRPLTAYNKRSQKIDDMKPKQEPPKKSLSDRLAEYGQRVDRAAGNVIENLPLALIRASAEVAKAGVQLTGAVLDSGVKLAGAFVNAPELGVGRGLESSLSKGLDKVINWTTKMMSDKKGGR